MKGTLKNGGMVSALMDHRVGSYSNRAQVICLSTHPLQITSVVFAEEEDKRSIWGGVTRYEGDNQERRYG